MRIETSHQWHEINSALTEEAEYRNKNNLSLDDGYIGVESLGTEEGYAYAGKEGYGNMATYLNYRVAFKELRRKSYLM